MEPVALEARYGRGVLAGLRALQAVVPVRSLTLPAAGLMLAEVETPSGMLQVELVEEGDGACTVRPPEGRRGLVMLLAMSKVQAQGVVPPENAGLCTWLKKCRHSHAEVQALRAASGLGVMKVPRQGYAEPTPAEVLDLLAAVQSAAGDSYAVPLCCTERAWRVLLDPRPQRARSRSHRADRDRSRRAEEEADRRRERSERRGRDRDRRAEEEADRRRERSERRGRDRDRRADEEEDRGRPQDRRHREPEAEEAEPERPEPGRRALERADPPAAAAKVQMKPPVKREPPEPLADSPPWREVGVAPPPAARDLTLPPAAGLELTRSLLAAGEVLAEQAGAGVRFRADLRMDDESHGAALLCRACTMQRGERCAIIWSEGNPLGSVNQASDHLTDPEHFLALAAAAGDPRENLDALRADWPTAVCLPEALRDKSQPPIDRFKSHYAPARPLRRV